MASQATDDLKKAYYDLVDARKAYERAAAFYDGSVEEVYSSQKVTRLLAKFGLNKFDNINFSHIPVDTVADKLFINSITADKDGDGNPDEELNSVIQDLWDYNELGEEAPINHRNACKYGDHYAMVWPVIKRTPRSVKTGTGLTTPGFDVTVPSDNDLDVKNIDREIVAVDIIFHDPLTTRLFYDTENPRRKVFAIRSWTEGENDTLITRANMYYPDRIERYVHKGKVPKRNNPSDKWEHYTKDGREWQLPNPFDEVPFFHFRTDRTYGKPLHINAYGPQLAINKLVTSHLATVDFQSFPQRYALMDPDADPASSQGADFNPLNPDDDDQWPEDDDNESQLEADPAAVWSLNGVKAVGQFDPANADNFLKPFDRYVKAMAQVTDTPMWAFDKGSSDRPPSGESLKQINGPMITKAQGLQLGFGSTWRNLTEFALFLMGVDVERVYVTWRPAEVVSDKAGWDTVKTKQEAGVPVRTSLIEAGYLPEQVDDMEAEVDRQKAKEMAAQLEQQDKMAEISAKHAPKDTPKSSAPTEKE